MALRDALLSELFEPGRLSIAFCSGSRQFALQPVAEWSLAAGSASANVVWEAPVSTSIDSARLYDGDDLLETFAFRDENGRPDFTRLLPGMKLDYDLTVTVG